MVAATARTRSDYSVHVLTPTTFTPMVGEKGEETEVKKKKKLSVYVCVTEHVHVLAAISHHRPD